MPKLSKKKKLQMAMFINPETGRRTYNELCRKCTCDCKQSYRTEIIDCPLYLSKRKKVSKKAPLSIKTEDLLF